MKALVGLARAFLFLANNEIQFKYKESLQKFWGVRFNCTKPVLFFTVGRLHLYPWRNLGIYALLQLKTPTKRGYLTGVA